ncbi:Nramp family divalent metal transporter [Marinoscillum sp.]|uniref:Nramp family divalent metal transporter n=1 Tax=Marinoscillum sp. TaxID=2024838 RepID=UPI003BAAAA01
MKAKKPSKSGSPGLLIAAAFIGPGTVTVCTIAGATYGFELLWVMIVSIVATIFLQNTASRLGIVSRLSLTALIRQQLSQPILRMLMLGLVFSAIVIGNGAYEAGNISGAVLGLESIVSFPLAGAILGLIAGALLWTGSYHLIQKVLTGLVALMSASFIITAIMTRPNPWGLLQGMFLPSFSSDSSLIILALVGTTIVPYNLFLHASLAKNHWNISEIGPARKDTIRSILIGGIISMAIIITAGGTSSGNIQNAGDLAKSLEPLYGSTAKYLIALGLFSAGITSAITAPLAAAYVAQGCFDWDDNPKHIGFRATWICILLVGAVFSSIGYKPLDIIKFAQVANGLLLPIIAALLIWLSSRRSILGQHTNSKAVTMAGILIALITLILGIKSIWTAF